MIDIHTHVLYGVDHGANDISDSLGMLAELESSGVTGIYLTSHYYSDTESADLFVERYDNSCRALKSAYKGNIQLKRGAEVFISPYFGREIDERLMLEGTSSMLIELPFWSRFPEWVYTVVERLVYAGITPVIAHIERYPAARNKRTIKKLFKMGAIMHSDTLSVKEDPLVMWAIRKGYVSIVASDYHVDIPYVPVRDAIEHIEKKLGKEIAESVCSAPERLLRL